MFPFNFETILMGPHMSDEELKAAILAQCNRDDLVNRLLDSYTLPTFVKGRVIGVTPKLARQLLNHFHYLNNRTKNIDTVHSYARQMLRKQWVMTGEPCLITVQGIGYDFQHRMWAVIESGETNPNICVPMMFVTSIPCQTKEDFLRLMMATGYAKPRTKRHVAEISVAESNDLDRKPTAAETTQEDALRNLVEWILMPMEAEAGALQTSVSREDITNNLNANRAFYTGLFQKISDLYKGYMAVQRGIFGDDKEGLSEADLTKSRLPVYAATYHLLSQRDSSKADEFISAFFNSTNDLPKGNAVDGLRQGLLGGFNTGLRDKMRPVHVRKAIIKAFDFFVAGKLKASWKCEDFGLPGLNEKQRKTAKRQTKFSAEGLESIKNAQRERWARYHEQKAGDDNTLTVSAAN